MLCCRRLLTAALVLFLGTPALPADVVRFLHRRDYPVGPGISGLALVPRGPGDLPDLIAATDRGLLRLGNDGDGGFGGASQIRSESFVKTFAVGDFDGDGRLDLAYPDGAGAAVQVLYGRDDGFTPGPALPLDEPLHSIYAADIDGRDGIDLLVGSRGKVVVYPSRDRGFGDPLHLATGLLFANQIVTADVNGDGILDLFVTDHGGSAASLLLSEPADPSEVFPSYAAPLLLDLGFQGVAAALADVDRDGLIDAIVVGDRGMALFPGARPGPFGARRDLVRRPGLSALGVLDFNGDGHLDIATCDRQGSALLLLAGDGKGEFRHERSYGVGREPTDLAVGDIDGDGLLDLAIANRIGGSATVLRSFGNGYFAGPMSLATEDQPGAIVTADLNGDGFLDLAVANERSDTIGIYLGDGSGGFRVGDSVRVGRDPRGLISGDFDGDGHVDLAAVDFASDDVAILAGRGDGAFAAPLLVAVGLGPTALTSGDFNSDGHPDLAVANTLSESVTILFGDGHGRFPSSVNHPVPFHPTYLLAGDLNRDDRTDLVVGRAGQESVSILFGNEDGHLDPPTSGNMGGTVRPLVADDLDDDGLTDLVVLRDDYDDIGVMLGLPRGSFTAPVYFPVSRAPHAVVAGDFDGDGLLDLAVVNRGSMDVLILLNRTKRTPKSPH
jgi:hypothetical protein